MRTQDQDQESNPFSSLTGAVRTAAGAALPDRAQTLERVARWLVRDLVEKQGQRSPGELTDAAFAVLHPELGGRRIEPHERALIAEYHRIRRELVEPVLAAPAGAGAPASAPAPAPAAPAASPARDGIPPLGGPRTPPGFTLVRRERDGVKGPTGLSRYGGGCLHTVLRALAAEGRISISEDELDTFQRIANVETKGEVQGLNTWDSAVVSVGFFQWTLKFGKLQRWIASAPAAFRRYGIELDPARKWKFEGYGERQPAIRGAESFEELRWNGWAERFYRAGLDPEIIAAEVELGKQVLREERDRARPLLSGLQGGYSLFQRAYAASAPLRGLYHEARNNRPAYANRALSKAVKRALDEGVGADRLYELVKQAITEEYAVKQQRDKAKRLIAKTERGLDWC